MKNLLASSTPLQHLSEIAYAGQPENMRRYRPGYTRYFNEMPLLLPGDEFLTEKVAYSKAIMNRLADDVRAADWIMGGFPEAGGFDRTILSMEAPVHFEDGSVSEGAEFIVARWGDGHTSPVHGHAPGYEHEDILSGRMLIHQYRLLDPQYPFVRPVRSDLVGPGNFVSQFTTPNKESRFRRTALIHNFKSVGDSVSLHYIPEHTRDGRDNGFTVEYFEEERKLNYLLEHSKRISIYDGIYSLRPGDVLLVRSENVPELGDHYIVITGPSVLKPHGYRPQDIAIQAPKTKALLDRLDPIEGVILLKFDDELADEFRTFHHILVDNKEVIFPKS